MIERLQKKRNFRATLKRRKQEIEQCLAGFGFARGPHRLLRRTDVAVDERTYSQRLHLALESLGPVFSAFGIYMSSRVDLLPVNDCLELAVIPDLGEATPISIVRALIAQEIGRPQEEVYLVFEEVPFESRLMFQSHRAVLNNGKAVTVKVIHPELATQLECDLELLPVLKSVFTNKERTDSSIENAIVDFRRTLRQQMNFSYEVRAFEELGQEAKEFEILKVPEVHKDLCSSKVMTIERLAGLNLDDIIASLDKRGQGGNTTGIVFEGTTLDLDELARRLCLVWLWGALLSKRFPAELRPQNVVILPNKQIAFTGGEFLNLPKDAKKNLRNYLIAASNEDPDRACSYLLREMVKDGRPFNEEELQHRFREIVPFRDGGWSRTGDGNSLAEHLFLHWKLARERGLKPQRHLLGFYRGLFQTTANARRLAPRIDPLLEALQDVRIIEMFAQFQEMTEVHKLSDNLDKYAAMMIELPQKLDDVLTLVAEGSARMKLQGTKVAEGHRGKNSSTVVISLLLVLAAVVLLSHHLAAVVASAWVERITAIVFVLLGALLLRAAGKAR